MSDLKFEKTIVIVGASRGIGLELVKLFADNGRYKVIALARNTENKYLAFPNITYLPLDLESKTLVQDLDAAISSVKTIDILINNAGKLINKAFTDLTSQDLQSSYQVNVLGVMQTVQQAVPKMLENGGHIVNISSMGGFQGTVKFAGLSAYSTSKAAVASFTELFAEEYKTSNIKMNCLCLGAAQTEMLEEAFPGYEAPMSAGKMAEYIFNFALNGHEWYNGKILPVSMSTP
jgi:3-oxoacyl-[acyl-carrier protein] reductase